MMFYSPAYNPGRMWEIDPERLQAAMDRKGVNQSQLAEMVGMKQPSIGRLLSGETKTTRAIDAIAAVLETTPAYLKRQTDDPEVPGVGDRILPYRAPPPEVDPDEVEIDSIDLSYGMGGTFVDIEHGAMEITKVKFSRSWLRKFTHSPPEMLFTTSGIGDSMRPTIEDADIVIVDRSEGLKDSLGEKMWAVVFGGVGMIKRLRPMPDGTVKIMSDNRVVPDDVATDNDLHIVGRVIGVVRRH